MKLTEQDTIKGNGAWPSTDMVGSWRREARYGVAAASSDHRAALIWLGEAERCKEPLKLPLVAGMETLCPKLGQVLRPLAKGEDKRELQVMEEVLYRKERRILDGRQIYCWMLNKFKRRAHLARPQILEEI